MKRGINNGQKRRRQKWATKAAKYRALLKQFGERPDWRARVDLLEFKAKVA